MNAEQAKLLVEYFANLWQGELPATTKVLRNVPVDGRDYRPDEKSRTAWELATHLALGDVWFIQSIIDGGFKFDPEAEKAQAARFRNGEDLAAFYQREVPARLNELRALPAERLTRVVDFFGMMQQPNVTYLGFANNHSIHHRGQLTSYLRACGSKVPAIYGASADEPLPASAGS
ncbi:MAG TPA: DinB family protein [Vicinamibacterales bacterium]|nr:DinB family protein [Vicinamibacterales bacterium]